MSKSNNSIEVFFALLRAGLWESEVRLLPFGEIDHAEVYKIAEEQSAVGIVAAGLEHIADMKPAKKDIIQFIGHTLQLEEENAAMNRFIASLIGKLRAAGIYALVVKGQGIAQCYERPLWRNCGDVDLFLDAENYQKAKAFLTPLASSVETEGEASLHLGMNFGKWLVELHGALRTGLSSRIDKVVDDVQRDTFAGGQVRVWQNGDTEVYLPSVDNDIVFIFTHFLKHFYKGGLGVRQICDWCRLLWKYRTSINVSLLESRLRVMGLMSEWKSFGAFAVEYLGLPAEALPLYDSSPRWSRKARRIHQFIIEVGNFGQNRDMSYYTKYPYLIRKAISMFQRFGDLCRHARIFPMDSLRFFPRIMFNGLRSAARGE